jgi:hypothetical protein
VKESTGIEMNYIPGQYKKEQHPNENRKPRQGLPVAATTGLLATGAVAFFGGAATSESLLSESESLLAAALGVGLMTDLEVPAAAPTAAVLALGATGALSESESESESLLTAAALGIATLGAAAALPAALGAGTSESESESSDEEALATGLATAGVLRFLSL